ncbi:MAG TPA: hypothetical protein VEI06_07455 [Gemmatimonadaceae bacterium]|nr:hypothetical protein [Gemmatimonadaceae bacterium]
MSGPMKLDDFLKSQKSGFTATLEAIPDKPALVKVTPFREEHGCGCSSSIELSKEMIRSITPTGKFHFCCGKRLEVALVEFAENASVPVADLMKRMERPVEHSHAAPAYVPGPSQHRRPSMSRMRSPVGGGGRGVVGRWPLPGGCVWECIEVCVEFCSDEGWDCCQWETRCAMTCPGFAY